MEKIIDSLICSRTTATFYFIIINKIIEEKGQSMESKVSVKVRWGLPQEAAEILGVVNWTRSAAPPIHIVVIGVNWMKGGIFFFFLEVWVFVQSILFLFKSRSQHSPPMSQSSILTFSKITFSCIEDVDHIPRETYLRAYLCEFTQNPIVLQRMLPAPSSSGVSPSSLLCFWKDQLESVEIVQHISLFIEMRDSSSTDI